MRHVVKSRAYAQTDWGVVAPRLYYTASGNTWSSWNSLLPVMKTWFETHKPLVNTAIPVHYFHYTGSSIDYTVGGQPFNSCDHLKSKAVNLAYTSVTDSWRYARQDREKYVSYLWREPFPALSLADLRSCEKRVRQQLYLGDDDLNEGTMSMLPRFQGDIDIFRSLVELKDFKSLLKLFNKGAIPRLVHDIRGGLKHFSNNPVWETTGHISKGYLAWLFAIKPTISDLITISNQIFNRVDKLQEEFADAGKQDQTSRFRFPILIKEMTGSPGTYNNWWRVNGQFTYIKRNITMGYRYDYTMRNWFDAIVQYWGLKPTIENMYQLTPFSFVLDMVYNIGRSLKFMKTDDSVRISKLVGCYTIVQESSIGQYIRPTSSYDGAYVVNGVLYKFPKEPILLSGVTSKHFVRRLYDPNRYLGPVAPRLRLPSDSQTITLAALARSFLK